jgi:hypothetical protein
VPTREQSHHGQRDTLPLAGDGPLDVVDDAFYRLRENVVIQKSCLLNSDNETRVYLIALSHQLWAAGFSLIGECPPMRAVPWPS